jgi:hypothetical protein
MCMCGPPSPVFLDFGGAKSLFLDDLLGRKLADGLRALVGQRPVHVLPDPVASPRTAGIAQPAPVVSNSYGFVCGCGGDSYLATSFSSLCSFGIVLLAIAAGFMLRSSRKRALWMVGLGAAISLADTGVRMAHRWNRAPGYSDMMLAHLPVQLASNFLFQLTLPFGIAFLLARLLNALGPAQAARR